MKKLIKKTLLSLFLACSLIRCHPYPSYKSVYDRDLNCEQLKSELHKLEKIQNEITDHTGFCARNALLGMFFWPSIIINEVTAIKSKKAVQNRYEYLMTLYENSSCSKCKCEHTINKILRLDDMK